MIQCTCGNPLVSPEAICERCDVPIKVPQRYEPKAEQPLWQMDLRHKLKLEPSRNDAVALLLWQAIYSSGSSPEAAERLQFDVEELQRAIRIIREEE